jgi:uncharacterized membrane protein
MDIFLSNTVRAILLGVIVVAFGLNRLARAFPDVAWLQIFRLPEREMSEEERARRRRTANRLAGMEMVIAGLVLPLLYFIPTFMMFNEPKPLPMLVVGVLSIACIAVGIWIFARNL